jgi:hypothetical protein
MGISVENFYFRKGLPKITSIKEKFQEITGLPLSYTPYFQFDELVTDREDLVYLFEKSLREATYKTTNRPYFSCAEFEDICLDEYLQPETKELGIVYGIGAESMYFYYALQKTMIELGGDQIRHKINLRKKDFNIENNWEPYFPHERKWKRIKKWDEMNAVERASFKDPYHKPRK